MSAVVSFGIASPKDQELRAEQMYKTVNVVLTTMPNRTQVKKARKLRKSLRSRGVVGTRVVVHRSFRGYLQKPRQTIVNSLRGTAVFQRWCTRFLGSRRASHRSISSGFSPAVREILRKSGGKESGTR